MRQRDREVLKAAEKIFYTRGYAGASVQDIADELGILKGSIYHYIDSKEDLLFQLLTETSNDVEVILEEVQVEDLPPLDLLREYTRRQVEYTCRNIASVAVYYRDADRLSTKRRREVFDQRRTHERFVTDLITKAQANGEASGDIDPSLAMNALFGSMIWVYRWYRPGGRMKPPEIAGGCADFVLRGVVGERGGRH